MGSPPANCGDVKITAIAHGLDLSQSFDQEARPKGVHMSDLYNSYYAKLNPKKYGKTGEPPVELWTCGYLLEEGLIRRVVHTHGDTGSGRPAPMQTNNGVWFSPDLLMFNGTTRLGEIKLTFMVPGGLNFPWKPGSTYDSLGPKAEKYMTQMKLGCRALGIRDATLFAFFVPEAIKAQGRALRCWEIAFTQWELDEEWDLIMRHAQREGLLL